MRYKFASQWPRLSLGTRDTDTAKRLAFLWLCGFWLWLLASGFWPQRAIDTADRVRCVSRTPRGDTANITDADTGIS